MPTHVPEHQKSVLSPRELARALGVSESSVKRWVDDGALEAVRTAGGHRRITLSEAVRFIRRTGTPVLDPGLMFRSPLSAAVASMAPSTSPEAVTEALRKALHRDDEATARGLILSLYLAGWSPAAICDGPVRNVMARIGELWRHDKSGIYIEHRAVDTCLRALAELRTMLPLPLKKGAAPVAVGGAPAGDPYLLPSLMSALVLAEQGFVERNLGPNTPTPVLLGAIERYQPRIVWLACSTDARSPKEIQRDLVTLAEAIEQHQGVVVVGGRGLPQLGKLSPNVHVLGSMGELAAFSRGLLTAA